MARRYKQGRFIPLHPEKYRGDATKIRFMSSWELHTHKFLDNNPNVLEWNSEEIAIPYLRPTDKRIHNYFPDYWVRYRNRYGDIVEEVWEVKPAKEIVSPSLVGKRKRQQLTESITYAINMAKWEYAKHFCKKNGYRFRLMTEDQIFKN